MNKRQRKKHINRIIKFQQEYCNGFIKKFEDLVNENTIGLYDFKKVSKDNPTMTINEYLKIKRTNA